MTTTGDGPVQVLHFQPEESAQPRYPPDCVWRTLCGLRISGRCVPEGHPPEHQQGPAVGRTGEIWRIESSLNRLVQKVVDYLLSIVLQQGLTQNFLIESAVVDQRHQTTGL